MGMLLYLVKHSRPKIVNATQKLSKVNDRACKTAFHEMHHVMKYVVNTKSLGLKIEPTGDENDPWQVTQ